jgi:hypothetical protein
VLDLARVKPERKVREGMDAERADALESVCEIIRDYRAGEIPRPTPDHVDRWVRQFDPDVQLPLLREINIVLGRTYCSRETVESFLNGLLSHRSLVGSDPGAYWPSVDFLDIQTAGRSQSDLLEMFAVLLRDECGVTLSRGGQGTLFLYLDDGVFSGSRVLGDLGKWIRSEAAPKESTVNIVSLALHTGGRWYAADRLERVARDVDKNVQLKWWSAATIENRKSHAASSDVLWPTVLPEDEDVLAYARGLTHSVELRRGSSVGSHGFFSSAAGRHMIEQEFLKAGMRIRNLCPFLNLYQRPLGNSVLETLGFGSMIATFRNCPNSAPLALWASDPWYPLLPRRTN